MKALGAQPVALDLLDRGAVRQAVLEAGPEAIAHEATALADLSDFKHFDRSFHQTNRLRTEGTDALLAAAREAGVRRFVAQSYASARYVREGGPVKSEDDPLDSTVPAARESFAAMRHVEDAVTEAGGVALRYGTFYGASNDGLPEPVRRRQFPIIGKGGGVIVHSPRRRRRGHRARARAGRSRDLQHRGRCARPGARVASGARGGARLQAATTLSPLARAAARGRIRGDDGNRVPRCLEREGQARAGVGAALPELARRLQGRLRVGRAGGAARPDAAARAVKGETT